MAEESVQRRLAAVLAADVVGYSRMMELDESGTLERLQSNRQTCLLPLVQKHSGRVVKLMGDGSLVEFPSVVAAVSCALEIQHDVEASDLDLPEAQRIRYRIGVNLGDLIVEGDDLYGEGVNVAARLQTLAKPGGVAISQTVHDHVAGRLPVVFEDFGDHIVKNNERPIRVFGVRLNEASRAPKRLDVAGVKAETRPTVCILPFVNMSGDPEQDYFSDGITEDIIIDLSKVSALSVTARNTAFTFKGRAVDVSQVARQLRVSHVVEGSVRKAAGRVRIAAQLIDGARGDHVWAERYDRELSDIFALQDEISTAIVEALKVKLLPTERRAIENRSTHNPEAYQLYLLSRNYLQHDIRHVEIALRICQRAVEIDPNYARAWAMIAHCQAELYFGGRSDERGMSAAEKAQSLDPTLAEAHAAKGRILADLGRYDEALALHRESLRLDPNSYDVQHGFGRTCIRLGRHAEAIEHFERAAELLETDYVSPGFVAQSYEALGRHGESISAARRALERAEREVALRPDNSHAVVCGALALAHLGEFERAKEWGMRARIVMDPDDTLDRYNLACAAARMGDSDEALALLEACIPKMTAELVEWMTNDSDLAPLHADPRYQALIELKARTENAEASVATNNPPP
ncbi:adenylate/guanylate cyclase domain-containing protein [Ensifer sp. BR816]|uniref:adenylate/guanylate cyclase domain-containing protein n=1 Tax=Rhizobium sp. (strain BR816) TaxID=1057002 RepID=UPI00036E8EAD|nr:adenylate/guanylate cyclase domain-containing protein [Ensifer sp. BR816]